MNTKISEEITIERRADYGIILEKSYTLEIAYEFLKTNQSVKNLVKTLNPIWGEEILYFDYMGKSIVAISAKGSPIAVNAVERIRRTGGKSIVLIGTCGSTSETIPDGTFVIAKSAVRDEGVSQGYLDLKVPAMANDELTSMLIKNLSLLNIQPIVGVAYTTDKRYKENPDELSSLHKRAGVIYVDMETSAVLLVSTYHEIKVAAIKIVTDCAVKHTTGELKGIFDRSKDFASFVNPKLLIALEATLNTYVNI